MAPDRTDIAQTDLPRALTLAGLLAPERLNHLLNRLEDRLLAVSAAIAGWPKDRDALVSIVHQSQGSAGSLGLVGVMTALSKLEVEMSSASVISPPLTPPLQDRRERIKDCLEASMNQFSVGRKELANTIPGL